MLTELYRYALDHGLAAQPGFKPKRVKAYVLLSAEGKFLGVHVREKDAPAVYAPDIGAAANGTRYCNPLIEKAKIPLGIVEDPKADKNVPTKHDFFLSMLDDGSTFEPVFAVLAQALRDQRVVQEMSEGLIQHKLKGGDPIGFLVDGRPVEASSRYLPWWTKFRTMFSPEEADVLPRCLITGECKAALATVPKVSGLMFVGGHTAGDAFLCFDKDAFQSYGFKKSANAPVSEEAMTAVNAALTSLIAKSPVLGNAKLVHWYSSEIAEEEDLMPILLEGAWDDEVDSDSDDGEKEKDALRAAKALIASIETGERPERLHARYYMMPLSGANGRMMVRLWQEGSYEELYRNIKQWFEDLSLVSWNGRGQAKSPKLKALGIRLLKPGGDPKKVWSRMDEELPNLLQRLLSAIINGTALPDEIPARTLRWIRSSLLMSDEEKHAVPFDTETLAFQLLKAWLCRRQRLRGDEYPMEATCNDQVTRDVAYYCGQLMAVYVAIQRKAMPDVGVGVAERYYTAASANPAFALGKLAQLSQHHLGKLEPGLAHYFEDKISEVMVKIGDREIPAIMNMEQQTEFALGYYQKRAALYIAKEK